MLAKKEGRNYIVLRDGEKIPVKLNRKKTDKTLLELEQCFMKAGDIIRQIYEDNNQVLLQLLDAEVFFEDLWELRDGKSWALDYSAKDVRLLREQLQSADDEIPKEEDLMTLADIGFQNEHERGVWTKTIRDDNEAEIVEEIIFSENEILHRERTIIWEAAKDGRRSKEIHYKKLRTGKRLKKICENTGKTVNNR